MKLITALFAMTLLVAGCSGSSDDPDPAPSASADPSRSLDPDAIQQQAEDQAQQNETAGAVVKIAIAGGKVTPQGDRVEVKVGQEITLEVTSDVDEEIHVHSEPEHSYEVPAGGSITESFTIDTPGQVAVEAHGLDVTIVQLVVRP